MLAISILLSAAVAFAVGIVFRKFDHNDDPMGKVRR